MRIDTTYRPRAAVATLPASLLTNRISRREAVRFFGGATLATAGLLALGRRALAQDGGTPPPVATPAVGPQADGSTLWHVRVGAMMMEEGIEIHAFLPGEITINAGDSIWFDTTMPGFHTVIFLNGAPMPDLLIPDPEATGSPEAGAMPKLILNPQILFPSGQTEVDGSVFVNSGADVFLDPSQPVIFTFPKAGSFDYLCIPHASVMQARVVVQEAGSALPLDQAAVDAKANEEVQGFYAIAKADQEKYAAATSTARDDGTTLWEATVGAGGVTNARVQQILPKMLEIKVGDTVKWVNRSPGEPHTVTIVGSDTTPPEDSIVEQFADGSPKFVQNMQTFLPQGGNTFSGSGFVSSGFTGIPQLGLPMEWECTFETAGEWVTYCALHGDSTGKGMAATLVVSPK